MGGKNKSKKGLQMTISKDLFSSYMPTYLYFFFLSCIDIFYIVNKYKKNIESTNVDWHRC